VQARGYKNDALAALFLMNNIHYVQWSVESSAVALELLGVPWLERHKDIVEEWGAAYHDATWMPLVHMIKVTQRHTA
jgi:exocyst complex protein 7